MWKQRSGADWLEEGDRNTGYFHKVAEGRKKRNHIKEIQKLDGTITRKSSEMEDIFRTHFQTLFTAGAIHNPAAVLSSIEPVVTEEMNKELTAPYTQEEIAQTLKQMHPLKAPEPDGTEFQPTRGLRQGDPLFPFLFLFYAEALSGLLRQAETHELLHGARLCRTAPRVSHLLFADDCIVFARANTSEIEVISDILRCYEGASGQMVNRDKSKISFNSSVLGETKLLLTDHLGVQCQGQRGSYLGIPSTVGRSKTEIFQMLLDRTRKKSKDWKRRSLSGAGKMVLIKSVLQSIPTYLMSCFAIPDQVWRLAQNDTSLLARSLKARYYPRSDTFLASKAHNPSFAWTSLLVRRKLLEEGMAWRLGDGARIRMGLDRWLPDGQGNYCKASVPRGCENVRPSSLLMENSYAWDMGKLAEMLHANDVWKISSNLVVVSSKQDRFFWPHGKGNSYSVKLFLWKCLSGAVPTAQGLRSRSIDVDPLCRRCGEEIESVEHVLRDCKWAGFLWEVSPLRIIPNFLERHRQISDWFEVIRSFPIKELHESFANIAWSIWYARNMFMFQNKELSHIDCLLVAQRAVWTKRICDPPAQAKPNSVTCSRRGQIKIWCDAAVEGAAGMGFGILYQDHDHEGRSIGYSFGFFPGIFLPVEAEARAVLEGITLCKERGFQDVIVEMDCQVLYWLLEKHELDLSYLGNTLESIYSLASDLHQLYFSWTPRDGNVSADSLAHFALRSRSSLSFVVGFPSMLNSPFV
ncbi:uncharacterized protein LOC131008372 [Salvia miltiorrhiza]|uniref:uncharacterized protein LOC131008372 n=1 Tax=Salvia miltiorrhiza TaxID=226208 RepID=UPI0025ABF94A|nr:uncharacterized protein LOC131008372 [Salvia miltiorrhiza]